MKSHYEEITLSNSVFSKIVAGEHDFSVDEGTEQVADVVSIVQHEGYVRSSLKNDISLLKISHPLNFDKYVQPVTLPEQGEEFTGTALVSGWGRLHQGGQTPTVLQKVEVPIVPDDDCRISYPGDSVADSMMCAGETGKDSCQGDSGGPMVCGPYLCGIVSWGHGCARPNYPGVYTQVSYFVDWIKNNA